MSPKKIRVGTYQLGYTHVDLFIDPRANGGKAGWSLGEDEKRENIWVSIGTDMSRWYCYGTLLHEIMEIAFFELGVSWMPKRSFSPMQTDAVMFVVDHKKFDEATAWAGSFLNDCVKDFDKAYAKARKKK